jgi:hypothetical protein
MPLKSRKKSLVNLLHFIRNRREGLPRPHQNRWGSITQLEIPIHFRTLQVDVWVQAGNAKEKVRLE